MPRKETTTIHYALPTNADLRELGTPLSIYLATEPTSRARLAHTTAKSAVDEAIRSLRVAGRSHAEQEWLRTQWDVVAEDSELWGNLASSLVIFIAPDFIDEYVLPNALEAHTHLGTRFDLGPPSAR